jgi:hypothetical protein
MKFMFSHRGVRIYKIIRIPSVSSNGRPDILYAAHQINGPTVYGVRLFEINQKIKLYMRSEATCKAVN